MGEGWRWVAVWVWIRDEESRESGEGRRRNG
jgi:hypothetical protein